MNNKLKLIISGIFLFAILLNLQALEYSSIAKVDFSNSEEIGWYCSATTSTAFWINSLTGEKTNALENCTKYSTTSCCPTTTNKYCWSDGKCHNTQESGDFCSSYTSSSSCNTATAQIAKNSIDNPSRCELPDKYFNPPGKTCINSSSCECKWNGTSCNAKYLEEMSCTTDPQPRDPIGYCEWTVTSTTNNCNRVPPQIITFSEVKTIGTIIGEPCQNKTGTYPCPSIAKLDFITPWGLLIVVVLIFLFYFLRIKKKNSKKVYK